MVSTMKRLLTRSDGPKSMVMTVNAGAIPLEHWTQDPQIGGGRIIGEACHFIDLLRFLADRPIVSAGRMSMTGDTAAIGLTFADGSIGTVHYIANGHKSFPKERLEVFCGGRILQLDNFRVLRGYGWPGFRNMRSWKQDKGHAAAVSAFVSAVHSDGPPPIPFEELVEVTRAAFDAAL